MGERHEKWKGNDAGWLSLSLTHTHQHTQTSHLNYFFISLSLPLSLLSLPSSFLQVGEITFEGTWKHNARDGQFVITFNPKKKSEEEADDWDSAAGGQNRHDGSGV